MWPRTDPCVSTGSTPDFKHPQVVKKSMLGLACAVLTASGTLALLADRRSAMTRGGQKRGRHEDGAPERDSKAACRQLYFVDKSRPTIHAMYLRIGDSSAEQAGHIVKLALDEIGSDWQHPHERAATAALSWLSDQMRSRSIHRWSEASTDQRARVARRALAMFQNHLGKVGKSGIALPRETCAANPNPYGITDDFFGRRVYEAQTLADVWAALIDHISITFWEIQGI